MKITSGKLFRIFILQGAFVCIMILITSCHAGRYFLWNFPDLNDHKKFPSSPVMAGTEKMNFFRGETFPFVIPEDYAGADFAGLEEFLEKTGTVSYLVVVKDTIVFEKYFQGYQHESIIPSFSVAKVFVSALTGIAIQEGKIRGTGDRITDYLTCFKDSRMAEVTLEDLLNMRSGIDFSEHYSTPFADVPRYYYGRQLQKYIRHLKIISPPGFSYNYVSVNTLLLSLAIEKATGLGLSGYLESRIWQPLGMESNASWSLDSKKSGTVKSFCCLNAISMDFARFGSLYLNNGKWNNRQIIPEDWVKKSTSIINNSKDSQGYPYTYHWRVDDNKGYFAKGILGQYIMVFPARQAVVVRMGKKTGGIDWYDFSLKLLDQTDPSGL
ncbi:MAG: serine hydrolase [Bacteroidales bacterium]|nr:serine hydrolase [Bacteroidales bacterium]